MGSHTLSVSVGTKLHNEEVDLNGKLVFATVRSGMIKIEILAELSNKWNNTGPHILFQFLLVQNKIGSEIITVLFQISTGRMAFPTVSYKLQHEITNNNMIMNCCKTSTYDLNFINKQTQ